MAKRSRKVRSADASPGSGGGEATGATLPLALERVALRELSYREIPGAVPTPPPPDLLQIDLKLEMGAQARLTEAGCELRLEATVAPDAKYQPLEVRVSVSAFFRRTSAIDDKALLEFLQGPGVRIVFPYVRELVSSITGRGLFPAVWIDPVQLVPGGSGDN